jgi:hypothetical protein
MELDRRQSIPIMQRFYGRFWARWIVLACHVSVYSVLSPNTPFHIVGGDLT